MGRSSRDIPGSIHTNMQLNEEQRAAGGSDNGEKMSQHGTSSVFDGTWLVILAKGQGMQGCKLCNPLQLEWQCSRSKTTATSVKDECMCRWQPPGPKRQPPAARWYIGIEHSPVKRVEHLSNRKKGTKVLSPVGSPGMTTQQDDQSSKCLFA